jgi:hypothetical protein
LVQVDSNDRANDLYNNDANVDANVAQQRWSLL